MMRAMILVLACLLGTGEVHAQRDETENLKTQVELLKLQVQELERAVARLEADSAGRDGSAPPPKASGSPASQSTEAPERWLDANADFRYRHDWIEIESEAGAVDARNRARIRARGELVANLSKTTKFGFGIASGDEDPVSTNQTLGQQASSKDWRLDLAYFDWQVLDSLRWLGGKYKNPDYRPGDYSLLWDGDLRPEGMSLLFDSGTLFAAVGFNYIDSDTRGPLGDRYGYRNFQLGYRLDTGGDWGLLVGAGYFDFDTEGRPTLIPGFAFNNTTNPDGTLAYDYDEFQVFGEWYTDLAGRRLTAFFDYVKNIEINDENRGYAVGLRYGDARNRGDWEIAYAYQKLEADAVFGAFTDSDFAGGGTDNRGYSVSAAFAFTPATKIELTYFDTTRAVFSGEAQVGFRRAFLDLIFEY